MSKGLIKSCINANCGWKCCDFGSKGHIVMLPGEYAKNRTGKTTDQTRRVHGQGNRKHVFAKQRKHG